ncbi:unnamed protein product [Rhizoctonia solani]|uniref:Uncharacterized protein n=1 Tax=Rhizoctonia solani AG-3 Rhs1AP TaxID=1086054 RepID=X8JS98_9AGAM|nr:hypothetical protein RSOL_506550 [Rhizoctonia solani AG-3 Rhs1AP]CAE6487964.1 unnamed protein product [Rhizoctonia solani]
MGEDQYRLCTVHLRTKKILECLPSRLHLQQFLRQFGSVLVIYEWCFRDGRIQDDKPNNALVLFERQRIASDLLKASANEGPASFWTTHNVIALPVQGPSQRIFFKEMIPKIEKLRQSGSEEQPSGSGEPARTTKRQHWAESSHISDSPIPRVIDTRPSKRPRNGELESNTNGSNTSRTGLVAPNSVSTSISSRTPSAVPESPQWMRARIMQLESDLESARATRDLAVSEQRVAVIAHRAEQQARREAMAQKSAAEAAQSRAEAEQMRLRSELEKAIPQNSTPSREEDNPEPQGSEEVADVLERDLEETRDREHKLQLRKSHLESELEKANLGAITLEQANAEIDRLKSDLVLAQEQLGSTQRSLESLERKYSSTRRKYENSKEKLGTYKSRLENERSIVKRLQETLTPAAYKSLGATHETLGEFLSAMGLPPVNDEGNVGPKEEYD